MSDPNAPNEPAAAPTAAAMSEDDARELFGEAIDGALEGAQEAEFDALLARSGELREEYEAYRRVVQGLAGAAPRVADEDAPGEPMPSLVPKVQARLRRRSRGRYFRDRYAARGGGGKELALLVAVTLLLLLFLVVRLLDDVVVTLP